MANKEETWTIRRLREWTTPFLGNKDVEKPGLVTDVLLAHSLGQPRLYLYTNPDEEVPEAVRQRFRESIRRCADGCPVAYLVAWKEFYSLEFEVGPAVLIPRPDTEWVVETCLRLAKGMEAPRVLDVGTGSGALAVAVAKNHKTAQVAAVDVSPEALAVASRNAARHGVADRVAFLEGDLFSALPGGEPFDFVLSNPPYIPSAEIEELEKHVRCYEPRLALDGGPDGLAVFRRLAREAPGYLKPGGHLLIEIGHNQENAGREYVESVGAYEPSQTVRDQAGHPRVLVARRREC